MTFSQDEMERGPCKRCGAHTEAEAANVCRPIHTPSGSDTCGHPEEDVDAAGYFLHPTEAALDRLDAWVDEQVRRMAPPAPWPAGALTNCKREGWEAFFSGGAREACPFPPGRADLQRGYREGWDAAANWNTEKDL